MFLKFYEKGWVYRAATKVNWCPNDKTVLANEQVVDGRCDRCDSEVIQKELTQWMFKITEFADDLAGGLKDLDWQETAKLGQLNWIGRSEGAKIKFKLTDIPGQKDGRHFVDAFTTRADTLFGVTAVVISPELAQKWIDVGWRASEEVKEYVKKSLTKRELERQETAEKTGIDAGIFAVNPINDEKIPVWVADYVLGHYGTGAVMFVPAHDQRDYEFAKKYSLLIKTVVEPVAIEKNLTNEAYVGPGILANSGKYNGVESEDAKKKITEELKLSGFGDFQRTYRLHDWVLSRQRYWGVPIPMVNCLKCGYQPAPEKDLPIKLPSLEDFKPADDGRSPLAKATKWLKVKCPKCEGEAERETDTMDTFVDSSWYFMRYTDPKNKKEFASKEKMAKWLPVPMYIGGAEHTTMHLLYARFFAKALQKLGHVDFLEPFIGRRNRGIILGPDHQKMSKSRGNVVDPDIEVKKYGADAVRMYLAFMGPYEQGGPWSPGGIIGVYRFLSRVWNVFNFAKDVVLPSAKNIVLHKTIKKIGEDIQNMRFNTGVSELMKLLNELESYQLPVSVQKTFLQLLAPFAPHMTEEVWINVMKNKNSIHLEKWPKYDPKLIIEEKVALVVQVNGKTRDVIKASGSLSEEEVRKLALASDKIKKHLVGKDVKKFIYVPGRLINLVI